MSLITPILLPHYWPSHWKNYAENPAYGNQPYTERFSTCALSRSEVIRENFLQSAKDLMSADRTHLPLKRYIYLTESHYMTTCLTTLEGHFRYSQITPDETAKITSFCLNTRVPLIKHSDLKNEFYFIDEIEKSAAYIFRGFKKLSKKDQKLIAETKVLATEKRQALHKIVFRNKIYNILRGKESKNLPTLQDLTAAYSQWAVKYLTNEAGKIDGKRSSRPLFQEVTKAMKLIQNDAYPNANF